MSAITDLLMSLLSGVGNVLDTPGAAVRTALAGQSPIEAIFDTSKRVGGRDLLEKWGAVGANREGLDSGDVAGFLAEMLLDPTNLIGGAGIWKHASKLGKLRSANEAAQLAHDASLASRSTVQALNESAQLQYQDTLAKALGKYMPEDVAAATKAVDASGKPLRLYHGTGSAFDKYDPYHLDPNALYGPGVYVTDNPQIASSYAESRMWQSTGADELANANVRMQHIDARNPLDMDAPLGSVADKMRAYLEEVAEQSADGPSRVYTLDDFKDFGTRDPFADITPDAPGARAFNLVAQEYGPHQAKGMLRELGYDSIKHTGGQITGGAPHQVYIAFDPSQIYPPYLKPPAPVPAPLPPLMPQPGPLPYNYTNPLLMALSGYNAARPMGGYQ